MSLERTVTLLRRLRDNGNITQDEFEMLNTFEEIDERKLLVEALQDAQHALVTLDGLIAADGAAPEHTWSIDETKRIDRIDAALERYLERRS